MFDLFMLGDSGSQTVRAFERHLRPGPWTQYILRTAQLLNRLWSGTVTGAAVCRRASKGPLSCQSPVLSVVFRPTKAIAHGSAYTYFNQIA